ncbi:MAG: hypothetical protein ACI81R_002364 [Bradymonadia bacterium]
MDLAYRRLSLHGEDTLARACDGISPATGQSAVTDAGMSTCCSLVESTFRQSLWISFAETNFGYPCIQTNRHDTFRH